MEMGSSVFFAYGKSGRGSRGKEDRIELAEDQVDLINQ